MARDEVVLYSPFTPEECIERLKGTIFPEGIVSRYFGRLSGVVTDDWFRVRQNYALQSNWANVALIGKVTAFSSDQSKTVITVMAEDSSEWGLLTYKVVAAAFTGMLLASCYFLFLLTPQPWHWLIPLLAPVVAYYAFRAFAAPTPIKSMPEYRFLLEALEAEAQLPTTASLSTR